MRKQELEIAGTLLSRSDPEPAVVVNADSSRDVVLVCEHAGRAVPCALGDLGLTPDKFDLHIAHDIGAGLLSRLIAEKLDAPLILQPFSRLVIDCNRPISAFDAIPEISDGVMVPGNIDLDRTEHLRRSNEIFEPFHRTVSDVLDRHPRRLVISIHSFTPVLAGKARPWDIGFLFRKDVDTSRRLAAAVSDLDPTLKIGMNEPYVIDDDSDWFVPHHGERRGIAHSLIEVRNDHLSSDRTCERWADLLYRAFEEFLEERET